MNAIWKRTAAGLMILVTLAACFTGCTEQEPDSTTVSTQPSTDQTVPSTGWETVPSIGWETVPSTGEETVSTEYSTMPVNPGTVGTASDTKVEQLRISGYDESWIMKFTAKFGASFITVEDESGLRDAMDMLTQMGKQVDTTGDYGEEFFLGNRLVLIPMQSTSGSTRFSAQINCDGTVVSVSLTSMAGAEMGTADMADWLVLVPLPRAEYPENCPVELKTKQIASRQDDTPVYDK